MPSSQGIELPDGMLGKIGAEPPRDADHGDMATSAAMVLARTLGSKPRQVATELALVLEADDDIESVEVAGPGFVNLRFRPEFWQGLLKDIIHKGERFGRSGEISGSPVNVEYVSANPTGPMHVGHCRGAVVGDAVANMLAATGRDVTREYYVNDAGAQVDILARSVYLRYREALGEDIGDIPAGLYPGDYLVPLANSLAQEFGDRFTGCGEDKWLPVFRDRAIDAMMDLIRADLARLGIAHDVFFSERSLIQGDTDRVAEMLAYLKKRDLIYVGRLPPPKGKPPEDWEDRNQTLFRSTQFGDDVDRALLKSDGSYTYFASDIAYHYDKFLRGFRDMIDVLGADHGGYAKRMKAAVTAVSRGEANLEIQFCQLVKLFRGGEPVRMSKRSGDLVTLREVVDEVGPDAVRFMMLFRKAEAPLDFDFQHVTEQSKDNPVFYVQYAHARTYSVLTAAEERIPGLKFDADALELQDLKLLTDSGELALIRQMADWPGTLKQAAALREPHRIAYYLHGFASAFHSQWNRGTDLPHLRFIREGDAPLTKARLGMVYAVGSVLRNGLDILGVDAPEEMR